MRLFHVISRPISGAFSTLLAVVLAIGAAVWGVNQPVHAQQSQQSNHPQKQRIQATIGANRVVVAPSVQTTAVEGQAKPATTNASPASTTNAAASPLLPMPAAVQGTAAPLGFDCDNLGKTPCPDAVLAAVKASGVPLSDMAFVAQSVEANTQPFFAHNANQQMVLASTTKVVTAMAAIDTLGLKYRWRTRAYLLGELADGVLMGDLLIAGGGDATLNSAQLNKWFAKMQAQGLREIHGNIVIDRQGFRVQAKDVVNTPKETPENPHHRWPDALVVNEGIITAKLQTQDAQPVLRFDPPIAQEAVVQQVNTVGGCDAQIKLVTDSGQSKVIATGRWEPRCGVKTVELVTDHDESMIQAIIAGAWVANGGVLKGQVLQRSDLAPKTGRQRNTLQWSLPKKPWSVHESPPLATIIREMNKTSNNIYARHLMLSLSKGFPNQAANVHNAQLRSQDWLKKQGFSKVDIQLDNGAGLSRTERAKPLALVQLLRKSYSSRYSKVLLDSLPVAGKDGTLARRMKGSAAQGNAFLKTGSLSDTRSLAGYVKAKSGKVYAVAAIINHPNAENAVPALDAFMDWLVRAG